MPKHPAAKAAWAAAGSRPRLRTWTYSPRSKSSTAARSMFSSAKFWDAQIRAGHRLAAIGGSDSHNATNPPGPPGSIGWPTTAVEADELSVPAILNGIRAGRTFVDLTASHDKASRFRGRVQWRNRAHGRHIACRCRSTDSCADSHHGLHRPAGTPAAGWGGCGKSYANDGGQLSAPVEATLTAAAGRHWLRVEVRDSNGTLILLSSPLYINFPG